MATNVADNRIYRSRDALIGGVCAGIAEVYDLDAIVVRILAGFIVCLTMGLGAIAYIVLWVRMPQESASKQLYEITPESAESSSYGSVDCATGQSVNCTSDSSCGRVPTGVRVGVAVALVALFFSVALNLSPMLPGTEWWQFWPAAFVMAGLCLVVIPIETKHEVVWHVAGIIIALVAAMLLPISLGILAWDTLSIALSRGWILVLAAVAMFVIGAYRTNPVLLAGAAVCAVAFCAFALTACAVSGAIEMLTLKGFDGRSIEIMFMGGPHA